MQRAKVAQKFHGSIQLRAKVAIENQLAAL